MPQIDRQLKKSQYLFYFGTTSKRNLVEVVVENHLLE